MGGVYLYEELLRGAVGTMTGFAFPEILVAIHTAFTRGDRKAARDTFFRYLPLISYEGQPVVGLALRKEILRRRGAIENSLIRHPGPALDPGSKAELDEILEALGLDGASVAPVAIRETASRS
jgi:4-hydroxy-tetrahydrodipicolinate synthase